MNISAVLRACGYAAVIAMLAGCVGGGASRTTPPVLIGDGASRSGSSPGSLDGTFGHGGKAMASIALRPIAMAMRADQRIVVAGNIGSGPGEIAIVRLLPSGDLDSSFGSGGMLTMNMSSVSSLTLLSNGKILLGGIAPSGTDAELVQTLASGKLDSSFGSGGVVRFDYIANSSNAVLAVVLQADGKIVAGGFGLATNGDNYLTSLARFDAKGSPDPSFGANGIVALDLVGGVTALGLQSDGRILACGGFITPATSLVVRFLRNGTLDRGDGGGTLVSVAHTGSATFGGTNAFQLDGKLLQWKSVQNRKGNRHYIQVVRLLRDNSPDPGFQSVPFAFGSPAFDQANDVEIGSDGRLIVGGQGASRGNVVFGLARLMANGALDDSFGQNGRVVTRFAGDADVTAITLQADGKIVAAGIVSSGSSNASLVVARYWGD